MCTISWLHTGGGYEVFFNRDEQHSRPEAEPPCVRETRGLQYIAPTDPQSGGTWIAVNEYGVCFCLLNTYKHAAMPPNPPHSRGIIVPLCVAERDVLDGQMALGEAFPFDSFPPFALFGLEPGGSSLVFWSEAGSHMIPDASKYNPFSTSSVRSDEVCLNRQHLFDYVVGSKAKNAGQLARYHNFRERDDPALGVLMDREDARTVSMTRVRVSRRLVQMSYRARARDGTWAEPVRVELERKGVHSA